MKDILVGFLCIVIIGSVIYYLDPITDKLSSFFSKNNEVVILPSNEYTKNISYKYVGLSKDYIPYSYQDLLDIYYSVINNGWKTFTFYCPPEYTSCLVDAEKISGDELVLTHLNNYVHPFNSFTNVQTLMQDSGQVTVKVTYLYTRSEINAINLGVDDLLKKTIKNGMSDYDKIKAVHDYIINNTKYDVERNQGTNTAHNSYIAYGPLYEGLATCNGYTDLMAIVLARLNINNYKIATTPDRLNDSSSAGHIWNAVYINNQWLHLDLTWDDPVSSDGKDYLTHNYFLVTTKAMHQADKTGTAIEEHNFNPIYYLEFA